MIEYALIFALGFLAATLAGLMIAPAVQRRIVVFTENRMKATMPLSPQEVRAQKDMARAAYAAENAKLSQDIRRAREKYTGERVHSEKLTTEAATIATENAELNSRISEMNEEAGDLRSALRHAELTIDQLKTALAVADREGRAKVGELASLSGQANHLVADIDTMRIDIAGRDTAMESLKSRLGNIKDERDRLRTELLAASQKATALEIRLASEETRAREFEARLSRELSSAADKDTAIERRIAEVERLRERVDMLSADNPDNRACTNTGTATPLVDVNALEEDVRNQSAALTERLLATTNGDKDAALRAEMADLATKMIVLTAAREGATSPVHALIASIRPEDGGLAEAVRKRLNREEL